MGEDGGWWFSFCNCSIATLDVAALNNVVTVIISLQIAGSYIYEYTYKHFCSKVLIDVYIFHLGKSEMFCALLLPFGVITLGFAGVNQWPSSNWSELGWVVQVKIQNAYGKWLSISATLTNSH